VPSVVSDWFEANYGSGRPVDVGGPYVPQMIESGAKSEIGYGYKGPYLEKPLPPRLGASSNEWAAYRWKQQEWQQKTNFGRERPRVSTPEAQKSAASASVAGVARKGEVQRAVTEAAQRAAIRNNLTRAKMRVTYDASPLEPTPGEKPGGPVIGGVTSPSGNAAFNFDSNTKVQKTVYNEKTKQFEGAVTIEEVYGRPRNKWEFISETGPLLSRTAKPVTVKPKYLGDTWREAQAFQGKNGLSNKDVREWQSFFVQQMATGGPAPLKVNSFVAGIWDKPTQDAMASLMDYANRNGMTVEEAKGAFLKSWNDQGGVAAIVAAGGGGGAAARPRVETSKQFSITSLAKGGALLRQFLQQELGRDPSQGEINAYVRSLNGQERKNPQISTTRWNSDFSSSTTTTEERNVDEGETATAFVNSSLAQEKGGRQAIEMFDWLGGV
jgi:hypothetical protein